jgi:hypothetical protein
MAPRQFLVLLAVVSSSASASASAGSDSFGAVAVAEPRVGGSSSDFNPYEPYCSTTGNYTLNSPYQVNLFNLMHDLQSGATTNGGFIVSVAGEAPDDVFGLIMCHADRNWTQCKNCLQTATSKV